MLLCGAAGLDSKLGYVVEQDGVELGGVAEMTAKAFSALLVSVAGILMPGPSLSFKTARSE